MNDQRTSQITRQAELIIQSYDDGSEILGIEFSAPKLFILKMQHDQHEKF